MSRIRAAKPRAVVLVKDHLKSPQARVVKTTSDVALCCQVGVISRPSAALLLFSRDFRGGISLPDATVPARAPPV